MKGEEDNGNKTKRKRKHLLWVVCCRERSGILREMYVREVERLEGRRAKEAGGIFLKIKTRQKPKHLPGKAHHHVKRGIFLQKHMGGVEQLWKRSLVGGCDERKDQDESKAETSPRDNPSPRETSDLPQKEGENILSDFERG